MVELVVMGFVAGVVCGISPCILPVLPMVLVAGATRSGRRSGRARPVSVVLGLWVSFSVVVLAGSEIISAPGLPQAFLRDAGIALLVVIGVSFLVPGLSTWIQRPFARIGRRRPNGNAAGLVVGLALGLVFVACAGPILSAITMAEARHDVGWTAVMLVLHPLR